MKNEKKKARPQTLEEMKQEEQQDNEKKKGPPRWIRRRRQRASLEPTSSSSPPSNPSSPVKLDLPKAEPTSPSSSTEKSPATSPQTTIPITPPLLEEATKPKKGRPKGAKSKTRLSASSLGASQTLTQETSKELCAGLWRTLSEIMLPRFGVEKLSSTEIELLAQTSGVVLDKYAGKTEHLEEWMLAGTVVAVFAPRAIVAYQVKKNFAKPLPRPIPSSQRQVEQIQPDKEDYNLQYRPTQDQLDGIKTAFEEKCGCNA